MPFDQLILLCMLGAVVVLLVTEWIPLEVTALLTMGTLALTGLITSQQALSGFSSPAVVTIWAVFMLSGALDRTGVAEHIGRGIQRLAGRSEIGLITTLMLGAGLMSAVMNNVAVAALLLPVTMDLARANRLSPSRLLMPLAYGCLLGGLTTLIGTPPNILVSDALRQAGLQPFGLFDFTPIGLVILLVGTAFMVFGGRLMLPKRDVAAAVTTDDDLPEQYQLRERTFVLSLPFDNPLVGHSLAQSRLGSATGLYVVAIRRQQQTIVAPSPDITLVPGDQLFVQGRLERLCDIQALVNLISTESSGSLQDLLESDLTMAELTLPDGSPLAGQTLGDALLLSSAEFQVLALRRGAEIGYAGLTERLLQTGDRLLILGAAADLQKRLPKPEALTLTETSDPGQLLKEYRLDEHLIELQLVDDTDLVDIALEVKRLEEILGLRILSIQRHSEHVDPRAADTSLTAGDRLIALETSGSMAALDGLAALRVDDRVASTELLRSGQIGLAEAVLTPRSGLAGKTLRQLRFRDQYGIGVLAIWRAGRAYRSGLRDFTLEFGDALLLFGPLERLQALGSNTELIVLSRSAQQPRRSAKARLASLIMAGTLLPVLFGLVPIHLAVVMGAACMIMTGCQTMEEAYRAIEWRAVFLIAGLLPLGIALDQSGLAALAANLVAGLAGSHGPHALLAGLVLLTFAATCIIPTAALVLLMAPIALNTAAAAQLSPQALMMAIALAASASFLTPIAHPANILVMGPGGYRFRDYLTVGLPLTLLVFLVIMLLVPLLWPLTP